MSNLRKRKFMRCNKNRFCRFCLLLMLLPLALSLGPAQAAAEQTAQAATGLWSSLFYALQALPQNFDTEITALMSAFRQDSQAGWWLIGLSFLYGVLHAAGPGHGKAIISSYLIANNETLRRGIVLAFWSSLLQAVIAIFLVGLIFAVITGKQAQQAATHNLELIGAALIMFLGLRLLWRKSAALFRHKAKTGENLCGPGYETAHNHRHGKGDCSCHGHIGTADSLQTMNWRQALPLILSIGLRPCTGALVVMGFALINGLFTLGAAAVLAMSFGTFLIVCALAYIAVNAKKLALKLSAGKAGAGRVQNIMEWAAALFIFLSGLALLLAALY
ncbi:hypothetical protein DPQ22_02105 [Candidatus Tokpelaia sp.]|nr:hypothetical protein DPQ22_02105 [Candidatus Tokpelaia sp.]